jgi:hypothetical protein
LQKSAQRLFFGGKKPFLRSTHAPSLLILLLPARGHFKWSAGDNGEDFCGKKTGETSESKKGSKSQREKKWMSGRWTIRMHLDQHEGRLRRKKWPARLRGWIGESSASKDVQGGHIEIIHLEVK